MLVIARRLNQSLLVGEDIRITLLEAGHEQVRLGIQAPRAIPVLRAELAEEVSRRNVAAVKVKTDDVARLARHFQSAGEVSMALPVEDLGRSYGFYQDAFGFLASPSPSPPLPRAVRLSREGFSLWLVPKVAVSLPSGGVLILAVDDPKGVGRRALELGATPWDTGRTEGVGVLDPDRNPVLLVRQQLPAPGLLHGLHDVAGP